MPPIGQYTKDRLLAAAGDSAAKAWHDAELVRKREQSKSARAALKERVERGDKAALAEHEHRKSMNNASKRRRKERLRAQAGQADGSEQDLEAEDGDEEEEEETAAEEGPEDGSETMQDPEQSWGVNSACPTTRGGQAMEPKEWAFKGEVLVFPETELQRVMKNDKFLNDPAWQEYVAGRRQGDSS